MGYGVAGRPSPRQIRDPDRVVVCGRTATAIS
jgi:hypothetical protein